jgi:hypothetical protein
MPLPAAPLEAVGGVAATLGAVVVGAGAGVVLVLVLGGGVCDCVGRGARAGGAVVGCAFTAPFLAAGLSAASAVPPVAPVRLGEALSTPTTARAEISPVRTIRRPDVRDGRLETER